MSTFTGIPVRQNIRTTVDLIAQLIGLYRNPDESLAAFKERILDVYIHKAGVTYDGLYNGIARELALDAHTGGILIDVVRDTDGLPVNRLASLVVSTRYLTLYDDHTTESIQAQFDLRERGTSYFISELITQINAINGWEAIGILVDDYAVSYKLRKGTSLKQVSNFSLRASLMNNLNALLQAGNFLTGTLVWPADSRIFNEVIAEPINEEDFLVDYNNSIIYTSIIPKGNLLFQYQELPYFSKLSPVNINSFKDEELIELITEQILNENNEIINGIPTQDGAELINELLSVSPSYWGK